MRRNDFHERSFQHFPEALNDLCAAPCDAENVSTPVTRILSNLQVALGSQLVDHAADYGVRYAHALSQAVLRRFTDEPKRIQELKSAERQVALRLYVPVRRFVHGLDQPVYLCRKR